MRSATTALEPHGRKSAFRTRGTWLNCCQQGKALIDLSLPPSLGISTHKRPWQRRFSGTVSSRHSRRQLTAVVGTVQMLNCQCKRPPGTLRLKSSGGSETDGEHRDIVLLAEGFRHGSDLCGGTAAEVASTFEAEELAARVAGFEDAIGEKGDVVLGIKAEDGLGVLRRAVDAEREAGFNGNLGAVEIRRQMAGIGESAGLNRHVVGVQVPAGKEVANPS